ncbi:tRNA uridine-5-carboxymethylaminomethyl(34) synthesis GTPase MnmE [candidate division WOR-3 bacterium]|nr:tRNA uridine-5-carboxymethylaminomethyl(34) synthesis GTPase MnmE [candidate division WOR-3 bacterium]MCK4528278.1 tRNA uridine-5-carboxymethylaminomethyl(34) synthesis GTPase MnmE [candidate division WOR-3 bacterium]
MDTICAISTPIGIGAISLIRMSGKDSISIASRIISGKDVLSTIEGGRIIHSWIIDPMTEEIVDEVLISVFRAPQSYTGEDMIEISTHGGIVIPRRVLNLLLREGARLAERGEFTRRAFLNNKMSLLEAEALLNLIEARTEKGARLAETNLKGRLQEEINEIKNTLLDITTLLEASLDFEDRDRLEIDREYIINRLYKLKEMLESLISSYEGGRILIEGFDFAIVGKPNVGKSSLFNMLLKEDRAIVTAEPGTTRDVLEGMIDIDGYPVRLLDMVGIRSPVNEPERKGLERAEGIIESADGILFVMDASEPLSSADERIYKTIFRKPFISIANKSDLPSGLEGIPFDISPVYVSAKECSGINELNKAIVNLIENILPYDFSEGVICTTERQAEGVRRAHNLIENGIKMIEEQRDPELVTFDIKEAIDRLRELTGEISSEDVLDRIFSDFCIGK